MKEEYLALREEILSSIKTIKNYRSLLYTITVATLAFAVNNGNAILFLIPFSAIFPIYLLIVHQIDSSLRLGAYIYVFIEPNSPLNWETRLYEFDKLYQRQYSTKKPSIDAFSVLSICCIFLSILNLDFHHRNLSFYSTILLQIAILVACIYFYSMKRPDYLKVKDDYIKKWKKVQALEKENRCEFLSSRSLDPTQV